MVVFSLIRQYSLKPPDTIDIGRLLLSCVEWNSYFHLHLVFLLLLLLFAMKSNTIGKSMKKSIASATINDK